MKRAAWLISVAAALAVLITLGSVFVEAQIAPAGGSATEYTLRQVRDKLPASPPADHTTALNPGSVRISNGTSFVVPTTPGDTQPISVSSLPLPTGAATAAKQPAVGTSGTPASDVLSVQGIAAMTPLKIDGSGVTQPVSGTFWQATQPVSFGALPAGSSNIGSVTLANSTVAVTQSGTWNIGSISGSITPGAGAANLGKAEDAVSGDGDVGVSLLAVRKATPANTSNADGDYENLQVSAGRLWASAVIDSALPAGGNNIGSVTLAGTPAVTQSGTWTVQPGNTANTTAWLVTGAALTKGTQGATGFSTQDLKDAGRTHVSLYAENVGGVASEGSITISQSKGFAAATTGTSYTVTSGKTLRLTSFTASWNSSTTTLSAAQIKIRVNTGGAMALSSPIAHTVRVGFPSATTAVNEVSTIVTEFPDGIEIPAGSGVGITHIETAANGTLTVSLSGFEY